MPIVRLGSDVAIGTSPTDVTGMSMPVAANTTYYFRYATHFTTDSTATGIRLSVSGPASPTAIRFGGFLASGTGAMTSGSQNAYDSGVSTSGTGPGTTPVFGIVEGVLQNGANAGNLILRAFAENSGAGAAMTVLAGTSGILRQITGSGYTRVTTDQTVVGTTFANVTGLTFSVAANTNYYFRFVVHYTTNATTTGARFSVNGPASPTALRYGGFLPTGAAAANYGSQTAYDTAIFAATTGPGTTAVCGIISGTFRNGANAGTLALRFAAEVASPGSVTVLTNSHGVLTAF